MNGREDIHAVLSRIPGWERAKVRTLQGGLTNRTWFLEAGAARAVLKHDQTERGRPFNTRHEEAAVQAAAAERGIGGRVLHVAARTLVSEYVEGRTWAATDFDDDAQLADLAAALRRLHGLPLTGRKFDAIRAASGYFDALHGADRGMAERCFKTVARSPAPANVRCCHNDLVADNIVVGEAIRFIDWEFACDNDRLFDLAAIVVENRLSTERAGRLLDAYFGGDGSRWRQALAAQERLYEALAWLWRESRSGI